jgi:transcriptional regulator with XRE-family HTH domain
VGERLWRKVEEFRDSQPFPPSVRAIARASGISESTLAGWRGIQRLPDADHLRAFARLSQIPYRVLLDAALADAGYLSNEP